MANWQAVNVLTGTPEGPKYLEKGVVMEQWKVALGTSLANGDTVLGPKLPANCYLSGVKIDTASLDSGGSPAIAFEVGYTSHLAAFIAAGNTTARAGGIASANVAGTVGFTATTDTQILVTFTAGAATPAAGTMVIEITYTASP